MSDREPSMEEILSSIKRVIAEDNRRCSTGRANSGQRAGSDARSQGDSVLELTEYDSLSDDAEDNDGAGESGRDDNLLEQDKADSLIASLSALATLAEPGAAPQIVRSGETSIEQLVREMLRPLLKEWLNQNLPPMVDALVKKEIQRITKRG